MTDAALNDYSTCVEYNEHPLDGQEPLAYWTTPEFDLTPIIDSFGNNALSEDIEMSYTTKHLFGITTTKHYHYQLNVTTNMLEQEKAKSNDDVELNYLIMAKTSSKKSKDQIWKFNFRKEKGEIMNSFWLKNNDACYVPILWKSGSLVDITAQARQ